MSTTLKFGPPAKGWPNFVPTFQPERHSERGGLYIPNLDLVGVTYIGGPMRGHKHCNFPAFYAAEACLLREGWAVYNPARHDESMGYDFEGLETCGNEELERVGFVLAGAISWDLHVITHPGHTALHLLPGWEQSSGAKLEHEVASWSARDIFYPVSECVWSLGYQETYHA